MLPISDYAANPRMWSQRLETETLSNMPGSAINRSKSQLTDCAAALKNSFAVSMSIAFSSLPLRLDPAYVFLHRTR
jgi:hypothetical protein